MNKREITVLTDLALITCIVQKGRADAIIHAAKEAGAQGATIFYAHGTGVRERLGALGLAIEAEKEVINIIVSVYQKDKVFEAMYLEGKLDTPGMGFMYITPIEKAATYIPPSILEKLKHKTHG
ncbi:nitrogen regulatory protein P-II [Candidatus Magnetoovum chiemensis]|nr:nitrogen regulatory protein P-II [Candidatus Magnetoovum chiemensis]